MARYRITVLAHRCTARLPESGAAAIVMPRSGQVPLALRRPWGSSVIMEQHVIRAHTPTYARDLALVWVLAQSALHGDVAVVIDAVQVERLRFGRRPHVEHVGRRPIGTATERAVSTRGVESRQNLRQHAGLLISWTLMAASCA